MAWFTVTEFIPHSSPASLLARARREVVDCWLLRMLEVEDRWDGSRHVDGWSQKEGLVAGKSKGE